MSYSLLKHFFLSHSSIRPLLYTIIYISIKAILNGRLKDPTFLFKIPISTWENFFEIYKQFGHAPWKRFTNPPLECWTLRTKVLWFFRNTRPVTQHYIPWGPTLNNVYQHSYLYFRSLILFMPTLRCWSRCTAPHKEAHNMTINQWIIWLFTDPHQPAYWGKQLTFIETF